VPADQPLCNIVQAESYFGRQLTLQIAESLRSGMRLMRYEAAELLVNAGNFSAPNLGKRRSLLINETAKLLLDLGAAVLIDQPLRDIV